MSEQQRLSSLDTLRGVAISLVVLFHSSIPFQLPGRVASWVQIGNLGVQLFFLISAFTMSYMWAARAGESLPVRKFYLRRGLRIAPVFWLAMLGYGLPVLWSGQNPAQINGWDVLLTALFLNGFSVHAINLVVPGGWSIAVEMSFYLFFPLLATRLKTPLACVLTAFGFYAAGVGATALLRPWLPDAEMFYYYSLLTQAPIFPLGMALYRVVVERQRAHLPVIATVLALWLMLAVLGKFTSLTTRPFFWLPVFLMGAGMAWALQQGWHVRLLSLAGRRSYSLYLLHFAVIDLVLKPLLPWLPQGVAGYLCGLVVVFAISLFLAGLSFRFLESRVAGWTRHCIGWLDARSPAGGDVVAGR